MLHTVPLKRGSQNISKIQVGKRDSFFDYEPKTTPTVKYRRWLNIISPKMHLSIKVFHKQNLIFQILLTPIINKVTILSTDLIEK